MKRCRAPCLFPGSAAGKKKTPKKEKQKRRKKKEKRIIDSLPHCCLGKKRKPKVLLRLTNIA